jgi:hypothetical protein
MPPPIGRRRVEEFRRAFTSEIDSLAALYRNATADMIGVLSDASASLLARQRAIAHLRQYQIILAELRDEAAAWIELNIPRAYHVGLEFVDEGVRNIRRAGINVGRRQREVFTQVHREAVAAVTDEMLRTTDFALAQIGRRVDDVFRRIGVEEVAKGIVAGKARVQVSRQIKDRLLAEGRPFFVDRRGRQWQLDRYAEMVARTTTREAMSQGTVNRLREHGIQLAQVSAHWATDFCRYYENVVVSIGDEPHPIYPSISAINGEPPWHPNCVHSLTPFVERLATPEERERGKIAPDLLNKPPAELQRRFRKEFPDLARRAGKRQAVAARRLSARGRVARRPAVQRAAAVAERAAPALEPAANPEYGYRGLLQGLSDTERAFVNAHAELRRPPAGPYGGPSAEARFAYVSPSNDLLQEYAREMARHGMSYDDAYAWLDRMTVSGEEIHWGPNGTLWLLDRETGGAVLDEVGGGIREALRSTVGSLDDVVRLLRTQFPDIPKEALECRVADLARTFAPVLTGRQGMGAQVFWVGTTREWERDSARLMEALAKEGRGLSRLVARAKPVDFLANADFDTVVWSREAREEASRMVARLSDATRYKSLAAQIREIRRYAERGPVQKEVADYLLSNRAFRQSLGRELTAGVKLGEAGPYAPLTSSGRLPESANAMGNWVEQHVAVDMTQAPVNITAQQGEYRGFYQTTGAGARGQPRGEIVLSPDAEQWRWIHEYGHHLETHPEVKRLAHQFYEQRTQGEHEVKLKDVTHEGYADSEIAKIDRFFRAYVGRLYPNATEVVSMGLQAMSNSEDLVMMFVYDQEHFALMLRIGSGNFAVP